MSDRNDILNRLRPHERPAALPQPWQSKRQFDDLAARFQQALKAAKGEVYHAPDWETAVQQLSQSLREIDAEKVVVNDESPLTDFDLEEQLPAITWHRVGRSEGDLREFCAGADAGLSSADALLAETGSLVISSGPGKSRLATLLPPIHIALVPADRLTPDLFTWTAVHDRTFPANTILVSGPSKTADIEQTLAIGVHGPKRLIVILYDK